MNNAYDPRYEFRGSESEIARLKAQVLVSWSVEARLLSRLIPSEGTILELGCGPGFMTHQLCELSPGSRIIGLDTNRELLKFAQGYLGKCKTGSIELVNASVMSTGLCSNTIDVAISRYLFQHLQDPVGASKEVARVLKPKGKHIVIDIDDALWGIVSPASPEISNIFAKVSQEQVHIGRNRFVGRQLWRILQDAGYGNVELNSFAYHSDELGLEPFLMQMDPDRLLPFVRRNMVSLEEYALACSAYNQFINNPDAFVLMMGFLAHGEKLAK